MPASEKYAPREPIAIVGMGCRFPGGADNPEAYWQLMQDGRDAIVPVPPERWDTRRFYDPDPAIAGKSIVREGGFLSQDLELFDPVPFGIAPREAEGIDPQQRLLLEVTWEAFENAGMPLERLRGSNTGVCIGGFCLDTKLIRLGAYNRDLIDQHTAASATMTMLANRLSHVFDLRGPSLSIDTACSSSLVALHAACQQIWNDECSLAIAGGVNAMRTPEYFIAMSKGQFLSPHARCMTFDSRAQGYVRGEGAGVVILKPLSRALADGDIIRGTVLATGINQDGRTPGITLPNPDAQAQLIREVCRRAGIAPSAVDYVEAHGTGTQAGDKAELETLDTVLGTDRHKGRPCIVGAVKSQIGHLEAAAGVAGLIKTVQVLENRSAPANLHFNTLNPAISLSGSGLHLPVRSIPLQGDNARLIGAINSFGYGGTNAHAIIASAPTATTPIVQEAWRQSLWLPLSAFDDASLRSLAQAYVDQLAEDTSGVNDIVFSAACRRSHLPRRLVVWGNDAAELRRSLEAYCASGTAGDGAALGDAVVRPSGPAFVYSGMGPQWWGMGQQLAAAEPVFRDAMAEVDALFVGLAGWSVIEALGTDEGNSRVSETAVAQPANLMLQVALTRLLAHWGVHPAAVVGHSIGEVAAAWCSGALSLVDAVTVAWRRSQFQQTLASRGGGMLAVGMSVDGATTLLADYPSVVLAAINGPKALTLSGPLTDLAAIAAELSRFDVFHRQLRVEIPYHSPAMDQIREPLEASLRAIQPREVTCPWYSTVFGQRCRLPADAAYWWRNARQPVHFSDAIGAMATEGYREFLEIGPHPVLGGSIKEILLRIGGGWVGNTLRHGCAERTKMTETLATLHVRGYAVDMQQIVPPGRAVRLPNYPWQRQHHWIESPISREDRIGRPGKTWARERVAFPEPAWQVEINAQFFPWLNDHRISGRLVFPGAGFVAAAIALHREFNTGGAIRMHSVAFREMLACDPLRPRMLVSSINPATGRFRIDSRTSAHEDTWSSHADGYVTVGPAELPAATSVAALESRCTQAIGTDALYADMERRGFDYGPRFRLLRDVRANANEVTAWCEVPEHGADTPLPPEVLDAALQTVLVSQLQQSRQFRPMIPAGIGVLTLHSAVPSRAFIHTAIAPAAHGGAVAEIWILDFAGHCIVHARDVRFDPLPAGLLNQRKQPPILRPQWLSMVADPTIDHPRAGWFIVGQSELAKAFVSVATQAGEEAVALTSDQGRWPISLTLQTAGHLASAARRVIAFFDDVEPVTLDEIVATALDALALFRTCADSTGTAQIDRLVVVTRRGAVANPGDTVGNPIGAALTGLFRTALAEIPWLRGCLIDLSDQTGKVAVAAIRDALASTTHEGELALRDGIALQLSWSVIDAHDLPQGGRNAIEPRCPEDVWAALSPPHRPIWTEMRVAQPGPNELVMHTTAMLVINDVAAEWTGSVTSVGANVGGWQVGDHVHLLDTDLPATRRILDMERLAVSRIPQSEPFPVLPHLYAAHCLVTLANVQVGDHVLLLNVIPRLLRPMHECAVRLGARVIVASPFDSTMSGSLSAIDSRAADFGDRVQAQFDSGADVVVVGTEATGAVFTDLHLLAAGGRLLCEAASALREIPAVRLVEAAISLMPCGLDRFLVDREAQRRAHEWFGRNMASGWIPVTALHRATQSSDDAGIGASTGLRMLELDHASTIPVLPANRSRGGIRRDASYLVTGGCSGFGLSIAEWLTDLGVARVVLASRSGKPSAHDEPRLRRLMERTTSVTVIACDVSDSGQVDHMFDTHFSLQGSLPPLAGVFHGAMVLHDKWITELVDEDIQGVLAPKVGGALNLHRACMAHPIEHFVLLTSVSTIVGNPGQAAYNLANGWLDGFAHWRQALGLPALSVNLGAIAEVGIASRRGLLRQLEDAGMNALDSTTALVAVERLLASSICQAGVFDIDWTRWRRTQGRVPAHLVSLSSLRDAEVEPLGSAKLRAELTAMAETHRVDAVAELLRAQLASILRQAPDRIPLQRPLDSLGLDSLLTLEWVLLVRQECGVDVSAAELLKALSLEHLAERLLPRLLS